MSVDSDIRKRREKMRREARRRQAAARSATPMTKNEYHTTIASSNSETPQRQKNKKSKQNASTPSSHRELKLDLSKSSSQHKRSNKSNARLSNSNVNKVSSPTNKRRRNEKKVSRAKAKTIAAYDETAHDIRNDMFDVEKSNEVFSASDSKRNLAIRVGTNETSAKVASEIAAREDELDDNDAKSDSTIIVLEKNEYIDDDEMLEPFENVGSSEKPKDSFSDIKRARVVYESDVAAIKRRFIPTHIITWTVYIVCAVVFIAASCSMLSYVFDIVSANNEFDEVRDEYVEPEQTPVEQMDPDTSAYPPIVDFAALQTDNPDVAGWIRIPGTTVDYPIMTNAENDYYLHRNMYGQYSYQGAIFADSQNSNSLSENHIVIYGHNMIPPIMFHDVALYSNKAFFDAHRTVYIETPETTYVCKAIEMYTVQPTEYDAKRVTFESTQAFQEYLDGRLARSNHIIYDDYKRSTTDRLITLITCNSTGRERQVVECVVTQEYPTSMVPNVVATAIAEQEASR